MAIVKGALQFTGGIKGVSFYTRKGSDKVIMRTKGGASKQRVSGGPEFENLRKHQQEWGSCVSFAGALKNAVGEVSLLADFNLSPAWTGLGKNLMKLDKSAEVGQRRLFLSDYRQALENYELNRQYPFSTVLRVVPVCYVDREGLQATVSLPRISTEMSLYNLQNLPYFRIMASLGCVSDIEQLQEHPITKFQALVPELQGVSTTVISDWFSTEDVIEAQTLQLSLNEELRKYLTTNVTVLLSVGVQFGKVAFAGEIVPVKHAGCGKTVMSV